ncbi:hypothetical protein [Couchioplanes azureus]|uniref:hypothetical protein n=1 Tax=Couchioplanes caeruleus TaxID=56438 RepID=UPI0016707069|nr:hypothetical protein [Couchioplanes caeruleus]
MRVAVTCSNDFDVREENVIDQQIAACGPGLWKAGRRRSGIPLKALQPTADIEDLETEEVRTACAGL